MGSDTSNYVVDVVLSYRRLVLFASVLGTLIFGSGYYIGYYRARIENVSHRTAAVSTPTSPPSLAVSSTPSRQGPEPTAQPDNIQKQQEEPSSKPPQPVATGGITPGAAQEEQEESEQPPAPAPAPLPDSGPDASGSSRPPKSAFRPPAPEAAFTAANRRGNVYLYVGAFTGRHDAGRFADRLETRGYRTVIDGQLARGKHAVLVGPFGSYESAVSQRRRLTPFAPDVFPVRR